MLGSLVNCPGLAQWVCRSTTMRLDRHVLALPAQSATLQDALLMDRGVGAHGSTRRRASVSILRG